MMGNDLQLQLSYYSIKIRKFIGIESGQILGHNTDRIECQKCHQRERKKQAG